MRELADIIFILVGFVVIIGLVITAIEMNDDFKSNRF